MKRLIHLFLLLVIGCARPPIMFEPFMPLKPGLPGVDSVRTVAAWQLAESSFARDAEEAAWLMEEGQELVDHIFQQEPASATRDTLQSVLFFNEGADLVEKLQEADRLQVRELLEQAAEKFEDALDADPYDDHAKLWLARVYQMLGGAFSAGGCERESSSRIKKLSHEESGSSRLHCTSGRSYRNRFLCT